MKVGLFFGTYNPIHVGHLVIANHMAEHTDLDRVWMVVTPQSPFKKKQSMLANNHRLELVYLATKDYPKLQHSDIEFGLPQPNYTIDTIVYLEEKYPELEFALIMGEDNLNSLPKWKNHQILLERYPIYVYPRKVISTPSHPLENVGRITRVDAPLMELSSTFIRSSIKAGKNCQPMLPDPVWTYIDEMNFYK